MIPRKKPTSEELLNKSKDANKWVIQTQAELSEANALLRRAQAEVRAMKASVKAWTAEVRSAKTKATKASQDISDYYKAEKEASVARRRAAEEVEIGFQRRDAKLTAAHAEVVTFSEPPSV